MNAWMKSDEGCRANRHAGNRLSWCNEESRNLSGKKKANGDINRYYQPKGLYICNLLLIESINPKRFTVIVKI